MVSAAGSVSAVCMHDVSFVTALQLIVVGLLALAVLLIYAVISFAILHNFFDPENDNLFCETLWQCFVTVTREGLLDTLGAVSRSQYYCQYYKVNYCLYN